VRRPSLARHRRGLAVVSTPAEGTAKLRKKQFHAEGVAGHTQAEPERCSSLRNLSTTGRPPGGVELSDASSLLRGPSKGLDLAATSVGIVPGVTLEVAVHSGSAGSRRLSNHNLHRFLGDQLNSDRDYMLGIVEPPGAIA
jgi:hypothetical protein